jgi:hypothetical protein
VKRKVRSPEWGSNEYIEIHCSEEGCWSYERGHHACRYFVGGGSVATCTLFFAPIYDNGKDYIRCQQCKESEV